MNTKPLIYALSGILVALGLIMLISELQVPSQDPVIFSRNLVTSVLAVILGIIAPLLIKKFTS